ncbi:hypothetical protein MJO28_014508 [Puccinia striiformis f. sp. tritici]|uniref:Uncharacterized protein n=3 Tax=Puccinia striiformis TaxID=27350 RepID=A0A0L0W2I5_9BASI|nr:hypothetical protein Pst134EA_026985 [Puccinia striiformis f. sp. tritici]KAI9630007.1 hypothetical protein KEM48_012421 [Puccinia striiformis f. sp. tritici PST-130]KNF05758.1 hypothetical protein PSTG_01155 [Puccinia striiformis f. sp. tritici PST-78]POV97733.1 hypothetical protein PSTT_14873 [Puccinia striiformis]KAH9443179.1 hypothetical protein Pst134EB_027531 [Puccinia striiformis f. sp. tritici]KAH9450282.1 hypothetical protein Pst134EA_026985 [Puccinia striiformis f. sp. tritici]
MQLLAPITLLLLTASTVVVAREQKDCYNQLGAGKKLWYLCFRPEDVANKDLSKLLGEERARNKRGHKLFQCGGKVYTSGFCCDGKGIGLEDTEIKAGSMAEVNRSPLEDSCVDFPNRRPKP